MLQRTKAHSNFLVSEIYNYDARKTVLIADGRIPPYLASRYIFDEDKLTLEGFKNFYEHF